MNDISYTNDLPDNGEYYALFLTTGWNEKYNLTEKQVYESIKNSYYIVSAYAKNKLVGFGRIISDGVMHALIVDMIVDPEFQRMGIGNAILDDLVGVCQGKGIPDIQLFCADGKENFYLKNGFKARPVAAPGMEYVNNE
jgi:ribosomal protein S18 acetylase RimI-like enzyme